MAEYAWTPPTPPEFPNKPYISIRLTKNVNGQDITQYASLSPDSMMTGTFDEGWRQFVQDTLNWFESQGFTVTVDPIAGNTLAFLERQPEPEVPSE
jgi:hypothetical protein